MYNKSLELLWSREDFLRGDSLAEVFHHIVLTDDGSFSFLVEGDSIGEVEMTMTVGDEIKGLDVLLDLGEQVCGV